MTVTVIVSSPRRDGYGERLAASVVEGIESAGKKASVHRLNEMGTVRQCQNCEACKNNGGACILKDDIAPVIDEIRDAEGIVFVTSIQFNEMNGLFKMVFDRLYCFLDINATTTMEKGKKVAVIVTASADESSAERVSRDLEKVMVEHFFCVPVGRMPYVTWMMPLDVPMDQDALDRAREIGAKF